LKIMPKHENLFFSMPDFDALIVQLEIIRPKIDSALDNLAKALNSQQSNWEAWNSNDARMNALARLGMLVDCANLSLTFINRHLLPLNNSWWQDIHKPPFEAFNDYHKSTTINTFNNAFIKFAFLQSLFSEIDNTFRIFLRQLDPSAANGAKDNFDSVYNCLKKKLKPSLDNSEDLVNLLRESRNTIHNNSAYFNKKSNNDLQITYKGKIYDLKHGKPIDFVSWEWLFEMLEDVLELFLKLIYNPQIVGITSQIVDPFSKNRKIASK
jgi:hypothetical protein